MVFDLSITVSAKFTRTRVKDLVGNIIEIGCWEGKSTTYLANEVYPENIICNDTWLGNIAESELTGKIHATCLILEQRNVYSTFINNMNILTNGNYTIVKQDCIKWLEEHKHSIKFCHVDASHDYYSVKKTIELLLPLMVSGGILCGGNFLYSNMKRTDLHGGVEKAVRESLPDFKNEGNLWYWIKP